MCNLLIEKREATRSCTWPMALSLTAFWKAGGQTPGHSILSCGQPTWWRKGERIKFLLCLQTGTPPLTECWRVREDGDVDCVREILRKPQDQIKFVEDRPGHDRRYAIDSSKMRKELDWKPTISFEEGLQRTVEWYRSHPDWVQRTKSGEYRDY